jgi:hypothetical protein
LKEELPVRYDLGEESTIVVTAVGILDYLPGFTCGTTERSLV